MLKRIPKCEKTKQQHGSIKIFTHANKYIDGKEYCVTILCVGKFIVITKKLKGMSVTSNNI